MLSVTQTVCFRWRTEGLRPFAGLITHVCGKRSECIVVVQCLMTDQPYIINVSNEPEAHR